MLRVYSSKNAKIQHFGSKMLIFEPKCWILAFFGLYTRSMPFFWKVRHKITYFACQQSFAFVSSPKPSYNKFRSRLDHIYFSPKILLQNHDIRVLRLKSLFKAPIIGFWNILIWKLTGSANLWKGSMHTANFACQQSFGLVLSSKRWKDKVKGLLDRMHFSTNI